MSCKGAGAQGSGRIHDGEGGRLEGLGSSTAGDSTAVVARVGCLVSPDAVAAACAASEYLSRSCTAPRSQPGSLAGRGWCGGVPGGGAGGQQAAAACTLENWMYSSAKACRLSRYPLRMAPSTGGSCSASAGSAVGSRSSAQQHGDGLRWEGSP